MAMVIGVSLYLWDSGFTLLRRLRGRENIFYAHRSHLYQRLANGGWGHARVATLYGALAVASSSAAWIAPAAGLRLLGPLLAGLTLVWALLERAAAAPADAPVLP